VDDFESMIVETDEAMVNVRCGGAGPAVLLLHGFPETLLMWRDIAPLLAAQLTVVCADLRGYGNSSCPPSTADHAPYSKRVMAREMVAVMARLGHDRFAVAGHDRGGRVAYRAALDHPAVVRKLALLDVLPVDVVWDRGAFGAQQRAGGSLPPVGACHLSYRALVVTALRGPMSR
jgi:haloacetate dehalogenase